MAKTRVDTRNYGKNHPRFLRGGAVLPPRGEYKRENDDKDDPPLGNWLEELELREKWEDEKRPQQEPDKNYEKLPGDEDDDDEEETTGA